MFAGNLPDLQGEGVDAPIWPGPGQAGAGWRRAHDADVAGAAALVLMAFSGSMSKDLTTMMHGLIANSYNISVDGPALPRLFQKIGSEMMATVAIPFLVLMLAALGGNIIQHRLVWSEYFPNRRLLNGHRRLPKSAPHRNTVALGRLCRWYG
jgi:hypothetical protein